MTGQLADFLSAHSERVAEIWAKQAGGGATDSRWSGARGPRQFINAVLIALSADDVKPLIAYHELDADKLHGLDQRLEQALGNLGALRPATDAAAEEAKLDADSRRELAVNAADDLAEVARRISVLVNRRLVTQLSTVTSNTSARGASLSITMHELRRPLTILNSYGQLLSTGMLGQMPESAQVAIEGITASTEMMVRMVNALAELSRLEDPDDQLTLEKMTLDELVSGALEAVTMEAKLRECEIDRDVDAAVALFGDRRRLTLALTNILGNAVKHAPNNSTIWVRGWTDDDGIHVTVRDEGPGFPQEDAAHLFEKYYRSVAERQRKVPGSGLGLYIVKTVAERHNGTVLARSQPGKGAEFELKLPSEGKPA
jgi:signal transduction histidine kinase